MLGLFLRPLGEDLTDSFGIGADQLLHLRTGQEGGVDRFDRILGGLGLRRGFLLRQGLCLVPLPPSE